MQNVTGVEREDLDIWPYVDAIPNEDLHDHAITDLVESVFQTPDGRYDHVLVMTHSRNVYLVIVVDLKNDAIFGHFLLDLNAEYGLSSPIEGSH